MVVNFIVGLLGFLAHVGIKYYEATQKAERGFSIIDYIKHNYQRVLVSFGSYAGVCVLYFLRVATQFQLPSAIVSVIDGLHLQDLSYSWVVVGYMSDSIIRNITKMAKELLFTLVRVLRNSF